MPVYVDKSIHHYRQGNRRMVMCHMLADSLEELHKMADSIGINRKWFQSRASTPHYDICKSKRALAVAHGAVEVNRHQLVTIIRRLRKSSV